MEKNIEKQLTLSKSKQNNSNSGERDERMIRFKDTALHIVEIKDNEYMICFGQNIVSKRIFDTIEKAAIYLESEVDYNIILAICHIVAKDMVNETTKN